MNNVAQKANSISGRDLECGSPDGRKYGEYAGVSFVETDNIFPVQVTFFIEMVPLGRIQICHPYRSAGNNNTQNS